LVNEFKCSENMQEMSRNQPKINDYHIVRAKNSTKMYKLQNGNDIKFCNNSTKMCNVSYSFL